LPEKGDTLDVAAKFFYSRLFTVKIAKLIVYGKVRIQQIQKFFLPLHIIFNESQLFQVTTKEMQQNPRLKTDYPGFCHMAVKFAHIWWKDARTRLNLTKKPFYDEAEADVIMQLVTHSFFNSS
jgi:hypothetical protein